MLLEHGVVDGEHRAVDYFFYPSSPHPGRRSRACRLRPDHAEEQSPRDIRRIGRVPGVEGRGDAKRPRACESPSRTSRSHRLRARDSSAARSRTA